MLATKRLYTKTLIISFVAYFKTLFFPILKHCYFLNTFTTLLGGCLFCNIYNYYVANFTAFIFILLLLFWYILYNNACLKTHLLLFCGLFYSTFLIFCFPVYNIFIAILLPILQHFYCDFLPVFNSIIVISCLFHNTLRTLQHFLCYFVAYFGEYYFLSIS